MKHYILLVLFLVVLQVVSSAPGSCPPTLSVDICEAACGPGLACEGSKMCCPTACGGAMCVDPMTQRHFITLVKKGRCPEYPRGPWVCSHTCTSDSDCPRALKCCPNRCGALTCQKPDPDEPTDVEGR
ncbi:Whey acidic protein [Papilio machaon]|uniref:Whey acidic protein n=1 Tax=Papilio machaon TaxID=76193 RepID=A0A194QK69_PAPMA|nr:whey acidic protein [Papilio machaon]KPJ05968.1 Whey acidic protein [Papilio machaon]